MPRRPLRTKRPHLLEHELSVTRRGFSFIAGIDEAGRGCLAGPVVAAAVILPFSWKALCEIPNEWPEMLYSIDDSKKLSPQKRETLYGEIRREAVAVGVGIVEPEVIDRINIHQATLRAMKEAVSGLDPIPGICLVDGRFPIPGIAVPQNPIIGGDQKSFSVAAASIVAKVTRDALMRDYAARYSGFRFDRHKGYATREHYEEIRARGPSPIHRKSFTLFPNV